MKHYERPILRRKPTTPCTGKPWTAQEIELAEHLLNSGADDATIFAQLGRSRKVVRAKLTRIRPPADPSLHRATVGQTTRLTIPDDVIADRDRRLLETRTPTEQWMGDPVHSRSALGRRDLA